MMSKGEYAQDLIWAIAAIADIFLSNKILPEHHCPAVRHIHDPGSTEND